jgi:hypothetical protein
MKQVVVIVLIFALGTAIRGADYVPAMERFGQYSPNVIQGVVGGIPTRSGGNVISVATYGWSSAASASTNGTAFTDALAASAEGDIISIPAGTFNVPNLSVPWQYKNRTIRGAGMESTILLPTSSPGLLVGGGSDWGSVFNAESGITAMTAGSAVITVSDGSIFPSPTDESTYRIGRIHLANEGTTPVLGTSLLAAVRTFTVVMVSRSGNNITLSQPLPSNFAAGATGATFELGVQNALLRTNVGIGVEDLTIAGTNGTIIFGLKFEFAFNCWAKNVKVYDHSNYGVTFDGTVNCEVRKSRVNAGLVGSNKGGFLHNTSSYSLVEDNIFVGSFPNIEVNAGSMSNVFAYNFYGTGVANINHGPHNSFNLYEGSSVWFYQSDGYFGGASEDTLFRNWGRSDTFASLKRLTRYYNMVGNIVGTPGETYSADGSQFWGAPNIGNNDWISTAEPSTGDWWQDWDLALNQPKQYPGTLTTRTNNTTGIITLNTGTGTAFSADLAAASVAHRALRGPTGDSYETIIDSVVGDVVNFHTASSAIVLPDSASTMTFDAGFNGFQERDLDVINTTIRKANYYVFTANIPAGESLGGDTLPNSYYHTSKPAWFGNLAWPAYDPSSPPASEAAALVAIPAGYRYVNGNEDYLGSGGGGGGATNATVNQLNVGTLNIQ